MEHVLQIPEKKWQYSSSRLLGNWPHRNFCYVFIIMVISVHILCVLLHLPTMISILFHHCHSYLYTVSLPPQLFLYLSLSLLLLVCHFLHPYFCSVSLCPLWFVCVHIQWGLNCAHFPAVHDEAKPAKYFFTIFFYCLLDVSA